MIGARVPIYSVELVGELVERRGSALFVFSLFCHSMYIRGKARGKRVSLLFMGPARRFSVRIILFTHQVVRLFRAFLSLCRDCVRRLGS